MTSAASSSARQQITAIAKRRAGLLGELVSLAQAQRQMLVNGDHSVLVDNIKAQDDSLSEIERLDGQEESILESAPDALRSSPDFYQQYLAFAREAAQAAERLRLVVEGNRELLDTELQYVAFSLGAISTAVESRQSYDPRSEATGSGAALMLDLKV